MAPACTEDGRRSNTGSPAGAVYAATGTPRGAGRAGRVAERPVGLKTRGVMPVEERGLGCGGMTEGRRPAGVALAYEPRVKGQRVPKHHMRRRRGRVEARCCQGVNRPGGAPEMGTAGEAVQLPGAGARKAAGTAGDRR